MDKIRNWKHFGLGIMFCFSDVTLHTIRFLFGAVFAVGYLKGNKSEMLVSGLMIFIQCYYLRRKQIQEENNILDPVIGLQNCVSNLQKGQLNILKIIQLHKEMVKLREQNQK